MSIKIDLADGLLQIRDDMTAVYASPAEQVELLENLARILGFSLLGREERRELLELAEEVQQARGPIGVRDVAQAGIALSNAVTHSLRAENPQEV